MADKRMIIRPASEANTPEILASATAIANNGSRSAWNIQNLGTNTLYVRLGDGATTSVFHFALKAGSVNDDGTGGSVSQTSGVVYTGIITVAGTDPRYTIMELQ
jgi:hypothetical protein